MAPLPPPAQEIADHLDELLRRYPELSERFYRVLLTELHRRNITTIDALHDEARKRTGRSVVSIDDPNQATGRRWDETERQHVEEIIREHACRHFTLEDVDDLVNLTIKREHVQSLDLVANLPNVSSKQLVEKVERFAELPLGETRLDPAEVMGTRVALTRHFISDQLELIAIAKKHLQIRDFAEITRRIIGSDHGAGRIGGKAGGMVLAYHILRRAEEGVSRELPLALPESYYLRSDVIEDFIRLNRLDEYQTQKYKPVDDLVREYPLIRGVFRNGEFPLKIVHQLRRVLEELGTHPLIVRSSSLLEDRIGTAFSGKYASFFLANQGSLEERLSSLLSAIAEVYASILAPDPILYRREHNLIDYVEDMAVLIQKVVGVPVGRYFMPALAGVVFSRNDYRWTPRIKREDGLMRVVMGLGTRAVDRAGAEYPRMVALGEPTLRPESSINEIRRAAQQTLDVIDLRKNRFRSVRLPEVVAQNVNIPMFDRIVSVCEEDQLYPPTGLRAGADPSRMCITFDRLLGATSFASELRDRMKRLEDAYGMPIDLEFACDGKQFYLLQCRMQSQSEEIGPVELPLNVPEKDVLFDAHRFVRNGRIVGIEHVVYVDPGSYDAVPTRQRRVQIAHVIGRINRKLKPKSFVLVGPGRWGSNDVQLGVPVRYADINGTSLLVEVARQRDGFMPEVSFGTHFFQDLVEAGIHYLPLYPDVPGNRFNERFFWDSPNCLADIVPDDAEFASDIKVIHVPAAARGKRLTVLMSADQDKALAYLE